MRPLTGLVVSVASGCLLASCSASDKPAPAAKTTTVTSTVTTTPANLRDLDCLAPVVDLDVKWQRTFGDGIPPDVKPREVVPPDFFEAWTLVSATAHVRNLSPNQINTRGITWAAEWINPDGKLLSTRYQYRGLIEAGVEDVPELPVGLDRERRVRHVSSGDSVEFSRDYYAREPINLQARLREVSDHHAGPYTWVYGVDWWFTDPAVRQRCHQN